MSSISHIFGSFIVNIENGQPVSVQDWMGDTMTFTEVPDVSALAKKSMTLIWDNLGIVKCKTNRLLPSPKVHSIYITRDAGYTKASLIFSYV